MSLYKDLMMRSSHEFNIDKVTFCEFNQLPGIINDRLYVIFSEKKGEFVKFNEESVNAGAFIRNFKTIFIGDVD